MISQNEIDFINNLISNNLRPDGRDPLQLRPPQLQFLNEAGHLLYHQGSTTTLVKISSEIVSPKPEKQSHGFINFRLQLPSSIFLTFMESKKLSIEISKLLETVIIGSKCLDEESLCIVSGKYVWKVNVEIGVIQYDGNLVDAVLNAVVAALMDFRKPMALIKASNLSLHPSKKQPLSLSHHPFSFTFSLFPNNIILDPTAQEQQIQSSRLTITMNIYKEICAIHKPGGLGVKQSIIQGAVRIVEEMIGEFTREMRAAVKQRKEY